MKTVAVLLIALGACVAAPVTDDVPVPDDPHDAHSAGETCQGRNMLGAAPDALTADMPGHNFGSVQALSSNTPGVSVSVVGGNLVARNSAGVLFSGASTRFIGMRLKTQAGPELEITGVSTLSSGAAYALAFAPSKADYCDGAGPAVAMQGVIEADRFHTASTDVTFGCRDGVLQKCYGWGYVPGNDPNSLAWKLHQACMRMANADIYGNGEVHTRNLTPIVIRDLVEGANPAPSDAPAIGYPLRSPPPPAIPFFEGSWGWERGQGARCLAHDRWLSEPIDATPQASLPDPRMVDEVPFCDELSFQEMADRGALLFNASKRMDMYLNRWRNPGTGDVLTTVRGYYFRDPARRVAPVPGFTELLGNEGVLLRNLTGALTAADVTPMFLQHNPTTDDYVVATATPVAPGYVIEDPDHDFEGYTLNAPAPDLIPFGLFVKGTDYVSATAGPGTVGYAPVGPLHYVMRTASSEPAVGSAPQRAVFGARAAATVCTEQ
jgi:ADYC domain